MIWFAVFAASAGAGVVQSVTGFGGAVVLMLVLPGFMDMLHAPALSSSICAGLTVVLAWKYRRSADARKVFLPAVSYMVVSNCIITVAGSLELGLLGVVFDLFLMALSAYYLFLAKNFSIRDNWVSAVVCGGLAGLTAGLFSIGGPLMAVYYLAVTDRKESYTANSQMTFAMNNVINLGMRAARGIYTLDLLPLTLLGVVGINLGKLLGLRVLDRLDPKRMKTLVYAFVGLSGVIDLLGKL